MRRARATDKTAVARVVDARCDWMEARAAIGGGQGSTRPDQWPSAYMQGPVNDGLRMEPVG